MRHPRVNSSPLGQSFLAPGGLCGPPHGISNFRLEISEAEARSGNRKRVFAVYRIEARLISKACVSSERGDCMLREGFLGTAAPRAADLVLLLEIAMGAGLLFGAWFARQKRFRPHAWCQSVIVLLNLAVVAMLMIPSFRAQVLPRIPAKLGKPYFALATIHATLGSVTELAGLYILLSVGTSVLPERLRINKYKLWMRSVLVLWWFVLLLGVATYTRWYVPYLFGTKFELPHSQRVPRSGSARGPVPRRTAEFFYSHHHGLAKPLL